MALVATFDPHGGLLAYVNSTPHAHSGARAGARIIRSRGRHSTRWYSRARTAAGCSVLAPLPKGHGGVVAASGLKPGVASDYCIEASWQPPGWARLPLRGPLHGLAVIHAAVNTGVCLGAAAAVMGEASRCIGLKSVCNLGMWFRKCSPRPPRGPAVCHIGWPHLERFTTGSADCGLGRVRALESCIPARPRPPTPPPSSLTVDVMSSWLEKTKIRFLWPPPSGPLRLQLLPRHD